MAVIYPGERPRTVACPYLRFDGDCAVYCILTPSGDADCYHDLCPLETGGWGAWRSCADMLTAIYTGLDESGTMDDRIIVFSWGECATNYDLFRNIAYDELDAVGWSP